ncbi:phosphotransferase family protein [Novosphingobium pentaromativorans]|uniref:Aminoglycoside phosphotransferase domain-containing protein n=1 Tax=Novosphingobium pentaromativorans US6-1 TaxID=1088721 RepID=G6EAZ6_9SPHN|nr:phosphotransferase family protein [Novosphingobium pentaromativorans]EHJ61463.1 hypothetical protein NSU_1517 [Novosphingobium pentaromativorans US6-1]
MTDNQADYELRNPAFRKTDVAARVGRDMETVARQLEAIVSGQLAGGQPVTIENLKLPVGAGSSNETILFDARWQADGSDVGRGLVLRIGPADFQLFMDPRMHDQYRLLKALHAHGRVKVAEPFVYDDSGKPFGQPYMIMEKLHGRVPVSFPPYNSAGMLFDATVAERRRAWETAVDQLAQVALTPLDKVAFLAETDGDGSFEEHIEWWHRMGRWAKVDHLPAIADLREWLDANRPANPPAGLSWGDARIGNMMFGDDFTCTGVMDWEQMSLGGALVDMGWWLWFDRFHSDTLGFTRLEGLGDRAETLDRWSAITGIEVSDIEWYELFAGYKVALITARKAALEGNNAPGNNGNNNIATQQNATIRGLGTPQDILVPLEV